VRSLADLNAAPPEVFAADLAPLFEGAPRFIARLAEARPFETEDDLWATARAVARSMPIDEQVELLNAHPRIGADPAVMSRASVAEQGYDTNDAASADPHVRAVPDERVWVDAELAALNEAYEERFGFRFVVFVAGRPRAEILPLLERAAAADPDEELRRGLDDAVYIAMDRMASLRGPEPMREAYREAIALEVSRHLVGEIDAAGLVRAAHRLVAEGVESPAMLALSHVEGGADAVVAASEQLMSELGLAGWDRSRSGQLLALHAAASILGDVSHPIDGARRIVAVSDHAQLRELIGRWEASPEQREAIDVLILGEAKDLFDTGAA